MRIPCFVAVAAVSLLAAGCGSPSDTGSGGTGGSAQGGSGQGGSGGSAQGGSGQGGSGGSAQGGSGGSAQGGSGGASSGRGFPEAGPWVSFYGTIADVDGAKVADTFRIINIDADPDAGNTAADIALLQDGGKNKVISYLNLGSCESFRSYWDSAPPGHASCQSSGALTTEYDGYPDEMWADLSNEAYRDLLVNYVAPRLVEQGVDGFFLDNLEVVEHGANDTNGPCDAACSQGGLDLVWELREKFPGHLIVMQNATSDVTRLGMTHGVDFPSLLDGISHEEVYSNGGDDQSRAEMLAWKGMGLTVNGFPFWVACEEYAGECSAAAKAEADALYAAAAADGLSAYVTDESASQQGPCFWDEL